MTSLLFRTDSYKPTHHNQLPPEAKQVHSYAEARGGPFKEIVFMGGEYIKHQWRDAILSSADIDKAEKLLAIHFGSKDVFPAKKWRDILDGKDSTLLLTSLPEGKVCSVRDTLMTYTFENGPAWLTNYFESWFMQMIWYPTTVATLCRAIRKMILRHLEKTGSPANIDFMLHDFGVRGCASMEQAALGGMAHLTSFAGTDNLPAIELVYDMYGEVVGHSIPAMEHSTVTSWTKTGEADAYRNFMRMYENEPLIAMVADSFSLVNAIDNIFGKELKDVILARKGTVVIRPDSGDPVDTSLLCVQKLEKAFGTTVNQRGYKVLNSKVKVIYGDGVCFESIDDILTNLDTHGYSADNICFGMGGALLQKVNRDTLKFAIKASAYEDFNGVIHPFNKCPETDPEKASRSGIQWPKAHNPLGDKSFSQVRARARA